MLFGITSLINEWINELLSVGGAVWCYQFMCCTE